MRYLLTALIGLALLAVSPLPASGNLAFDTGVVWQVMCYPHMASAFAYHSRPWATWLLTCVHVIDSGSPVIVWREGVQGVYFARVIAIDLYLDCAVLKVELGKQPCLRLGSDVRVGEAICGFGYVTSTQGLYVTGHKTGSAGKFSLTSWQLGRGASGSPVVSMSSGAAVGIVNSILAEARLQPGNAYIPMEQVRGWLEREMLL